VVIGCLVFLFSVISPFFLYMSVLGGMSNYYWSYRRDFYGNLQQGPRQYWFSNYWGTTGLAEFQPMSWALVSMFIIQVLTLVFGVGFVFFNRRILSFVPVLLCLGVLGLMIYAGQIVLGGLGEYQQGYYLIFPSLALFMFAFVLNGVTKEQQTSARARALLNRIVCVNFCSPSKHGCVLMKLLHTRSCVSVQAQARSNKFISIPRIWQHASAQAKANET